MKVKSYSTKEVRRYNYLGSEIEGVYHEISQKLGLSDSVSIILYTICEEGESCLLQEICRRSGISKQTINSAIRKLEGEGIVHLEAVGGKSKNVCLTEAGKELAGKTALRIMELENEVFGSWPQKDVEQYLQLTEKYLAQLKEGARRL